MKNNLLLLFLSTLLLQCPAQNQQDSTRTHNGIILLPSSATHVNGLSLGMYNEPAYSDQTINGLSLELVGKGYAFPYKGMNLHKRQHRLTNNGVVAGPTLLSGKVNGISLALLISFNHELNGFSFSLFNFTSRIANGLMLGLVNGADINGLQMALLNWSEKMRGVHIGLLNLATHSRGLQVGLVNLAKDHRGIQIGLWNKNEKRSLPFINWQFKDKA